MNWIILVYPAPCCPFGVKQAPRALQSSKWFSLCMAQAANVPKSNLIWWIQYQVYYLDCIKFRGSVSLRCQPADSPSGVQRWMIEIWC